MDTQPPPPGQPLVPPPAGQPPYPYNNPPGYPPPAPQKNSRVWLYVVLGILGLCLVCGIVGALAFGFSTSRITSKVRELQPTLESMTNQIETSLPPSAGSSTQAAAPSGFITNITMASGVQGDNFTPVGATTTFTSKDTFHAVVEIQDAPASTRFKADWYAVNVGGTAKPNTRIEGNEIVTDGSRNLDFTLKPDSNWPAGTYRVEISVNGTLEQTVQFRVK